MATNWKRLTIYTRTLNQQIRLAKCKLQLGAVKIQHSLKLVKEVVLDNSLFCVYVVCHRLKLKHFEKFTDTTDALAAATAAIEGKVSKPLKKLLKKLVSKDAQEQLLVADAKLGNAIKEKSNLSCVSNSAVLELMRCIRSQADSLIGSLPQRYVLC
jgi:hypothetical protein